MDKPDSQRSEESSMTTTHYNESEFQELQSIAHINSIDKGFWNNTAALPFEHVAAIKISLMHSELSEALESIRKKESPQFFVADEKGNKKPEGWAVELADCVIRMMDFCECYEVDLLQMIRDKMEYNTTRDYMHGGKAL